MTYLAPSAVNRSHLHHDPALAEGLHRPAVLAAVLVVATGAALVWPTLSEQFVEAPKVYRVLDRVSGSLALKVAIQVQNEALGSQSDDEIKAFDQAWTAERASGLGPLVKGHLELPASDLLRRIIADSGGAVQHAILMDNRGRNVAIAHPTQDFWQGDEVKWRETFLKGPGSEHRSTPEVSHDARFVACWVSRAIADPRSGEPIGAVAIEVNAERAGKGFCQMQ